MFSTLQLLSNRWNFASLSLVYRYYYGRFGDELQYVYPAAHGGKQSSYYACSFDKLKLNSDNPAEQLLRGTSSRENACLRKTIFVSLSPCSTDMHHTRLHNILLLPLSLTKTLFSNRLAWVAIEPCVVGNTSKDVPHFAVYARNLLWTRFTDTKLISVRMVVYHSITYTGAENLKFEA